MAKAKTVTAKAATGKAVPGTVRTETVRGRRDAPFRWALGLMITLDMGLAWVVLLFPADVWVTLHLAPVPLVVLRWQGGFLAALALGGFLVRKAPAGQGIWVGCAALGHLLAGLALGFSLWSGEAPATTPWGPAIPLVFITVAGLVALTWHARYRRPAPG